MSCALSLDTFDFGTTTGELTKDSSAALTSSSQAGRLEAATGATLAAVVAVCVVEPAGASTPHGR